ncbi:hypothetical protein FACS1894110_21280 [Spirochaetia bacterium]|nr:hypothetical protein FACS1894110_21280 [Spirochaetia bacterium]
MAYKPIIAERAKEKESERKMTLPKSAKSSGPAINTREELAKIAGVSHDTIAAELKLKDIIQALPKANTFNGNQHKEVNRPQGQVTTKKTAIAELGLTEKQARNITALTPEAVEQAKAAARENDDIPTRSLHGAL